MHRKTNAAIFPKEYKSILWELPALFSNDELIFSLKDLCEELKIKLPVDSVYGTLPSLWASGRSVRTKCKIKKEESNDIIKKYNQNGISCCFTFSRYDISSDMLYDEIGNYLLKSASETNCQNYAIVSSDILSDYIRLKYPKIKLISSLLKPVYEIKDYADTPDYYNKLCTIYDKVVLRPEFCFDDNFLKKLKNKDKIIILANQKCIYGCKLSKKHYDILSERETGSINDKKTPGEEAVPDILYECIEAGKCKSSIFNNVMLSREDITRINKLGFTHFKLSGRTLSANNLFYDVIARYIFEPTGIIMHLPRFLNLEDVKEVYP